MTDDEWKSLSFGDVVENGWASSSNPIKRGYFVRRGFRRGRVNPGPWVEITDGCGKFWEISAGRDNRLVMVSSATPLAELYPINWKSDPDAVVEDDEPMTGRDYA